MPMPMMVGSRAVLATMAPPIEPRGGVEEHLLEIEVGEPALVEVVVEADLDRRPTLLLRPNLVTVGREGWLS